MIPGESQELALELGEPVHGPGSSPAALVSALSDALKRQSLEEARGLCSSDGWRHTEQGLESFVSHAIRQGYYPGTPEETCVEGLRAYVAAPLFGPGEKPLGRAYFMTVRRSVLKGVSQPPTPRRPSSPLASSGVERVQQDEEFEAWQLVGVSRSVGPAVLFVSAQASANLTWETLPPGPEARTWFVGILEQIRSGDRDALDRWAESRPEPVRWLLPRLHMVQQQLMASVRCVETRAHAEAGRFAVLIEIRMSDGAQESFWVMLKKQPGTGILEPFETSSLPSLKLLLQGIDNLI